MDLRDPATLSKALSEVSAGFQLQSGVVSGNKSPLFTAEEVDAILKAASSQPIKDTLKKTTQDALDRGAFGAPWIWVTNSAGVSEPFFGSDRFHYVYKFLDLPFQDIALLPPALPGKAKL
jgi:glutathione S-transferase kappa 1